MEGKNATTQAQHRNTSGTVEVDRATLSEFLDWAYGDPAIDTAPEHIREAEDELRDAVDSQGDGRDDGQDAPGTVGFQLYGVTAADLPEHTFDVSGGDYPTEGYDHEAHHAATVVMRALQDAEAFEWADELTGVAMAVNWGDA
jgi:hypothetical protein